MSHIPEYNIQSKRREKIKSYMRMKSLTDFLCWRRGETIRRHLKCLLYHTLPGGWGVGGGYEEGRWVTWPTREWRVPSEWLNVNACSASTGGFYTVHCFTPPTTRTYLGLEKGGGVALKFISTGIRAVTPMWRDAENRCICLSYNGLLYPCYTEWIISFSSPTGIEMLLTCTNKRTHYKGIRSFCRQTIVA